MLVIGCRVEAPQHLKKGHRYLTPRNADDHVAVALARACCGRIGKLPGAAIVSDYQKVINVRRRGTE